MKILFRFFWFPKRKKLPDFSRNNFKMCILESILHWKKGVINLIAVQSIPLIFTLLGICREAICYTLQNIRRDIFGTWSQYSGKEISNLLNETMKKILAIVYYEIPSGFANDHLSVKSLLLWISKKKRKERKNNIEKKKIIITYK